MASTATKGLPSLIAQIRSSTRATVRASLPTRASARTSSAVSDRESGESIAGTAPDACDSSSTVRRAIEASASSSSRAVATRSAVHAGMRRLTKARSRRLISSAQCRSSSTSTSGWRLATCSMSSATLSNRGRAPSLAAGRPARPASGSRRVNSARRAGCRAPRISSSALTSPLRQASTHGPNGRIESLS